MHSDDFTTALDDQGVDGLSNGAIALLDEVATGKITGEEDWWSGTDLWDFAANVEGSKMAFSLVRDFAESKGDGGRRRSSRRSTPATRRSRPRSPTYGPSQDGFVTYAELTDDDKRELTDLINALAEPLSQLTGTVLADRDG